MPAACYLFAAPQGAKVAPGKWERFVVVFPGDLQSAIQFIQSNFGKPGWNQDAINYQASVLGVSQEINTAAVVCSQEAKGSDTPYIPGPGKQTEILDDDEGTEF